MSDFLAYLLQWFLPNVFCGAFLGGWVGNWVGRWWTRRRRRKSPLTEFPRRDGYDTFEDYMAAVRLYMAAKGLLPAPDFNR